MALANTNEITTCASVSRISNQECASVAYAYTGDVWLGSVGAVVVVPGDAVEDDLVLLAKPLRRYDLTYPWRCHTQQGSKE